MAKRRIDTSLTYRAFAQSDMPDSREIEDPLVDSVPKQDPPKKVVDRELYLADEKLIEAVDLAIALGRPLLLQGEPGTGKTRLAHAVAYALSLPLEESYIKSTSRAQDLLYTYDVVKRLYDAQLLSTDAQRADNPAGYLDICNYIRLGPLGRAIARAQNGRRSVVLIDEIDKADLDFPNDLLWELDRLEFSVTEDPKMHYEVGDNPSLRPIVFVTHNEEKALPTAFLRRCIFHYVEFPRTPDRLQDILNIQGLGGEIGKAAISILLRLRELDLTKKPGLSELLDWVGYLQVSRASVEDLMRLPYPGVLLKQQIDQQRAMEAFATK